MTEREKQRDRLVELLKGAKTKVIEMNSFPLALEEWLGIYADHLLANGVKLPPVQIGQELWDIHYNRPRKWEVVYLGYNGKEWFINIYWHKDRHNFKTMQITYPFIGKMWYFTKEEAEQALQAKRAVSLVDGHIETDIYVGGKKEGAGK